MPVVRGLFRLTRQNWIRFGTLFAILQVTLVIFAFVLPESISTLSLLRIWLSLILFGFFSATGRPAPLQQVLDAEGQKLHPPSEAAQVARRRTKWLSLALLGVLLTAPTALYLSRRSEWCMVHPGDQAKLLHMAGLVEGVLSDPPLEHWLCHDSLELASDDPETVRRWLSEMRHIRICVSGSAFGEATIESLLMLTAYGDGFRATHAHQKKDWAESFSQGTSGHEIILRLEIDERHQFSVDIYRVIKRRIYDKLGRPEYIFDFSRGGSQSTDEVPAHFVFPTRAVNISATDGMHAVQLQAPRLLDNYAAAVAYEQPPLHGQPLPCLLWTDD